LCPYLNTLIKYQESVREWEPWRGEHSELCDWSSNAESREKDQEMLD